MDFFDESELARQQRLYEIQRLYQEQGNSNDFSDAISDAGSYQPAEYEVSPEFLLRGCEQQRLDQQRDVPDIRDRHPVHPQHLMDMDGSIIAAGVQAGIQGAQRVRVGDLRHDSDPRAFQRVFGNADVRGQLSAATRRELALRKDYDDLRRAFDDLVARMTSSAFSGCSASSGCGGADRHGHAVLACHPRRGCELGGACRIGLFDSPFRCA
jgi:hypothetical protein